MSVYKEAMYAVRELKAKQAQIFDDAADYGIPIKDEKDPVFGSVRAILQYFDPSTDSRNVTDFEIGKTVEARVMMLDEFGDGSEFYVTVSYTRQPFKRSRFGEIKGILSIDSPKW